MLRECHLKNLSILLRLSRKNLNGILKEIIASKILEVEMHKKKRSMHSYENDCSMFSIKSFYQSLQNAKNKKHPGVIAEVKKKSPSKGILRDNFVPSEIAIAYQIAGASCISVLTDKNFFGGCIEDMISVKKNCTIPILRKDFIIDPYQILQSRASGADCILLIVAALTPSLMIELEDQALSLGMDVLIEVHDESEVELALSCKSRLIGVNNRDLNTFKVDIDTSIRLNSYIPKNRLIISESGISSSENIRHLMKHNINSFLIGESLISAKSPGEALKTLISDFV